MDFNPNTPQNEAGMRIEPPPSAPMATGTSPAATASGHSVDRTYHVDLVDEAGVVHASVEKVIYVKRV